MLDKAFYRAAMWFAKMRTKIVNNRIVDQLRSIVERLRTSIKKKIMNVGIARTKEMLVKFEENGVLRWAPQLKTWIKDEKYILWLGLSSQAPYNSWIG